MSKYMYLIEKFSDTGSEGKATIVGLYTSMRRARLAFKLLPRKYQYTLFRLLVNQILTDGKTLNDVLGDFDHWHYGIYVFNFEKYSEAGALLKKGKKKKVIWPF